MVPSIVKKKILCSMIIAVCLKKKKKKRIWCKDWLKKRSMFGSTATILHELQSSEEHDFRNYLRMNVSTFYILLSKVEPYIVKKDTVMRNSITAEARLEATLRYLASGSSYSELQYSTRISKQSLSRIIPETCRAIYEVLKADYLQIPTTPDEWMRVAHGFKTRWNFPNCVGAIDGKHILIRPPPDSGSYFYNYKGSHSIVLMAICDANCEFLYVDIGCNGRVSDGGVWDNTLISNCIVTDTAGLPSDAKPQGSDRMLPYVFVADDAFPLQRHILKPFSHQTQSNEERIFSYRLSRARRTAENSFGILANRFRIFLSPKNLSPNKVEVVVLACTALHNFLRRDHVTQYTPEGSLDCEDVARCTILPGTWRETPDLLQLQRKRRNTSREAQSVRHDFMEYFNNEGAVSWQYKAVQNHSTT